MQVICDLGHFLPQASSKEQRARLMQVEAILKRYDANKNTIKGMIHFAKYYFLSKASPV